MASTVSIDLSAGAPPEAVDATSLASTVVGAAAAETAVVAVLDLRADVVVGVFDPVDPVDAASTRVVVGRSRTSVVVVFVVLRVFFDALVVVGATDELAGETDELGDTTMLAPGVVAPGGEVSGAGLTTLATSSVATTCADQIAGTVEVDVGDGWSVVCALAMGIAPIPALVPSHTASKAPRTLRMRDPGVLRAEGA